LAFTSEIKRQKELKNRLDKLMYMLHEKYTSNVGDSNASSR
jgi:hypothetical protein